jgi:hypothetical protein
MRQDEPRSDEKRRMDGHDARTLLDNPILKRAFASVAEYLDAQAASCPADPEKALRIIQGKQILAGIERAIVSVIEDGDIATMKIDEVERKKRASIFRR